jgi:hypothetical protein
MDHETVSRRARRLAARLEPVIGQVYFAPECHDGYAALGFAPSPGTAAGVALPDGPAYFTSRGSLLGDVEPDVVAAAFGVFEPGIVVAGVRHGFSLTDADRIFAVRRAGAVAQLTRILGPPADPVVRAGTLLERAVANLRPEGRPLFAGLRSRWDEPTDPWTRLFHLGDMLREYRGDAHVAAWTSAGLDAVEIGLLTECYIGVPPRTYIRTRGWDDAALDAAADRLRARGWLDGDALTADGLAAREQIEVATDGALRPAIAALGDDADELAGLLAPWGDAVRAAGGYIGGVIELWPSARDG